MTRVAPRHLAVLVVLLVGATLRMLAFSPYAVHHPDEALQYIEQAHRLVTGSGLIPWEYRFGMRSWALPLMLAGPMWLGKAIAPGSLLYVVLPRAAAALLASTSIVSAYILGRRISPAHGLVAMAVFAIWYETVYFSVHVLTEVLAVAAFLLAAALLAPGASRSRLAVGGALLMVGVLFRVHYSPAFAIYALVLFQTRWRDWAWLLVGAGLAGLVSAAVDITMGDWPFAWIIHNIDQNIIQDKASTFGRLGPIAYVQMMLLHWQLAFVPILFLATRGARHFPALGAAALVNLAVHLSIGHKEYRFILLSGQIAILLAAIGSVDLADRLSLCQGLAALGRQAAVIVIAAIWALASSLLAFSTLGNPGWRSYEAGPRLARAASERRQCGVALLGEDYWTSGGQTYLGTIPQFAWPNIAPASDVRQLKSMAKAFNAIIAPPGYPTPSSFRRTECRGTAEQRLCLAVRPGPCERDRSTDQWLMQRVMERYGR